jgi:SP family general alpha glucoside:H+ symporter-like MFS transporter
VQLTVNFAVFCGNPLLAYFNYFLENADLQPAQAFNTGVGQTAVGFVATCLTWEVLSYAGRRTIYGAGLYAMTVILFIIGIVDCAPSYSSNSGFSWSQVGLIILWTFLYQLTVGPLTFVFISFLLRSYEAGLLLLPQLLGHWLRLSPP